MNQNGTWLDRTQDVWSVFVNGEEVATTKTKEHAEKIYEAFRPELFTNDDLDENERAIVTFFNVMKVKCLTKYRKGRREHGTDFKNINYMEEMLEEIVDLVNYFVMKKVNKDT